LPHAATWENSSHGMIRSRPQWLMEVETVAGPAGFDIEP
jgi:hypothetical protein